MPRVIVVALVCATFLVGLISTSLSFADAPGATSAFRVDAANGYKVLVWAFSRRADGQGNVTLIASREKGGVIYFAPASVTPTAIHADLGSLGRIDLQFHPSGIVKQESSRCDKHPVSFEAGTYQGTFEFHGEEQYTQAEATSVHSRIRPILNLVCSGSIRGELSGDDIPGARLRLSRRRDGRTITLQFNKNSQRAHARFEASVKEQHREVAITRVVADRAMPGSAFDFADDLQTATLSPPSPFSGSATFHRDAASANRWTGDLMIDFPGESNVALTGASVRSALVHAEFSEESRPHYSARWGGVRLRAF